MAPSRSGHSSGKEITLDVPDLAKDAKGLGHYLTEPYREGTADTGGLIARVPTACGTIDFCVQIAAGKPLRGFLVGRKVRRVHR